MTRDVPGKIQGHHLQRTAYLYVRQSTMRQVVENTESTKRQYALRERAIALGWKRDQITVIDRDQGVSGAGTGEREGFQRLVTEVSMNRAGIVMGLEVSRLARNSSDWHRLLEICAVTDTLILDEDGVYDPAHFNDRLLLGLKGTMSEAELHIIRARLRGGILQKARRGELGGRLPAGFDYGPDGQVVLDPDRQVQESIRHLFRTFKRVGSGIGVVKAFRREGLHFPRRVWGGPHQGELVWRDLDHHRALWILKSPRYAGAYCFGRSRHQTLPDGRRVSKKVLPQEEWISLIRDAHPGYISWEQFEENQRRLRENSTQYRCHHRRCPPREGPALLQGLAICGRCGRFMTVRYHHRRGRLFPDYICQGSVPQGGRRCQGIPGEKTDEAIGQLLLEAVTQLNLDVALAVQKELEARADEVDRLRRQEVERAQHEADLAGRRFMQVNPDNRLVADELEGEWNRKLRLLREAQESYERHKQLDQQGIDEEKRARILALATDFPRLWNDPNTPQRERKRMAKLLLEDVTLLKDKEVIVHVRYKGGTTRILHLPLPLPFCQLSRTAPEVIQEVDRLLDEHTWKTIARILNERGLRSGDGRIFSCGIVKNIEKTNGLDSRYQRLRDKGMLTAAEFARKLKVSTQTIAKWRRKGFISGSRYNERKEYLYEPRQKEVVEELRYGKSFPGKPLRRA